MGEIAYRYSAKSNKHHHVNVNEDERNEIEETESVMR